MLDYNKISAEFTKWLNTLTATDLYEWIKLDNKRIHGKSVTAKDNEVSLHHPTPEEQAQDKLFWAEILKEKEGNVWQRERIKKLYTPQSFPQFLSKVIARHTEDYRESCYRKGYEPVPRLIMQTLFDIARHEGVLIEVEGQTFHTERFLYLGYMFDTVHGQGSFGRIILKNEIIYQD
jgi:hypothetical protein